MPTKDEARKLRVEAAQQSKGICLCSECGKPIPNARAGQKAHTGDCARLRNLRLKRAKALALRLARPVFTKTCECGAVFITTSVKRMYCQGFQCANDRQNAKLRALRATMTPAERREFNRRKYRGDKPAREKFKKPVKKVKARCPGCHKLHVAKFEYGYTGKAEIPWKGCPKYPDCAHPGVDKSLFGYEGARFSSA